MASLFLIIIFYIYNLYVCFFVFNVERFTCLNVWCVSHMDVEGSYIFVCVIFSYMDIL